jgi:endonuclease/exonuclease/phosphatase family metal-dependent hydrolase
MEELGRLADVTDCRILAGDFNAGPEASQRNFQHVLRHGYRDTFTANETLRYTWDPNNPLNAQGPHAHCPPQRCDHILVQGKTLKAETRIVLAEPIVDAPNGACTLSDHFGLLANITF